MVNLIVELEIPQLRGVDISYTTKIKQLLYIIAESEMCIRDSGIIASRKQVEITNLFPVCKVKDKDHLKTTKVNMFWLSDT